MRDRMNRIGRNRQSATPRTDVAQPPQTMSPMQIQVSQPAPPSSPQPPKTPAAAAPAPAPVAAPTPLSPAPAPAPAPPVSAPVPAPAATTGPSSTSSPGGSRSGRSRPHPRDPLPPSSSRASTHNATAPTTKPHLGSDLRHDPHARAQQLQLVLATCTYHATAASHADGFDGVGGCYC
ncbi:hypothetical protein FRC12_015632 [Ceratobasidium sp. 428]|nr:hypothetical protein FRC12_015632 [Ceratobasidium sp. 428]